MPTLSLLEGIFVFMRLSVTHIRSEKYLSPIPMTSALGETFPVYMTHKLSEFNHDYPSNKISN